MKHFFLRRWFLLSLVIVLFSGFYCSAELAPRFQSLPRNWRNWWVAAVMFLMALPLDAGAMWLALRRPTATLLAVAVNFALVPLVAWGISPLLMDVSRGLGNGLLIAAAVPSTVASAAVWTRRAGGNDAISLMVTMATNLSCFIFTPLILLITIDHQAIPGKFDPTEMMLKLSSVVVAPVVLAQLLRLSPNLRRWASRQKVSLGVVCQMGMLIMVLAGVVRAAERVAAGGQSVPLAGWLIMIASVLFVHLFALAAGHVLGKGLGIPRPDRIAVGFSGSQKTLLVGLSIAMNYSEEFGELALLPMVAYHVSQLLIDTVIADRLRLRSAPSVQLSDAPPA